MNSAIPGANLTILTPAGHMGLMERHYEVNEAVSTFINVKVNAGSADKY
jgi:hypothetical protein